MQVTKKQRKERKKKREREREREREKLMCDIVIPVFLKLPPEDSKLVSEVLLAVLKSSSKHTQTHTNAHKHTQTKHLPELYTHIQSLLSNSSVSVRLLGLEIVSLLFVEDTLSVQQKRQVLDSCLSVATQEKLQKTHRDRAEECLVQMCTAAPDLGLSVFSLFSVFLCLFCFCFLFVLQIDRYVWVN